MNKKIKLLIVLGIIAVISLSYGVIAGPRRPSNIPPEQSGPGLEKSDVSAIQSTVFARRRAKRTQFSAPKRDVFLPKSAQSGLVGIIWDKTSPKAMIGDNIVGIGDMVDGSRVVDIKEDSVILNDGSKDYELKLRQ